MSKTKFNLSANIENAWDSSQYISTSNARKTTAAIVDGYHAGIHSFTLIGTYGTGKSSFLLALESDLTKGTHLLLTPEVLGNYKGVEIVKIVGDYAEMSLLLARALNSESQENALDSLKDRYNKCKKQKKLLLLIVDEFGKVLEHASENHPERELYFLQKLSELANASSRDMIFITTLHQNFSAYARKLSEEQRNEWNKVKGRFQEVVFVEPVEQILFLAAEKTNRVDKAIPTDDIVILQNLAKSTKFVSDSYTIDAAKKLYPLDPFAAFALTRAIQRYGQNERSLFSFLAAKGTTSFSEFKPTSHNLYNMSVVYDYIERNFFSYLQEANADSMAWSGMRTAIERVEGASWNTPQDYAAAIKLVKTIGLLNLLGTASYTMNEMQLAEYAQLAMNITNGDVIIDRLISSQIIRHVAYKDRFVLFEGTDVDIEDELTKASLVVPKPINYIDDIRFFFAKHISLVKASYYHKGTPRYFNYTIGVTPEDITPKDDNDGYIELLFPLNKDKIDSVLEFSQLTEKALIFVVFHNVERIVRHIHNLNKYQYLLERVLLDKMDTVANREVVNLKNHETELLNKAINDCLFSYSGDVTWIYKGEKKHIGSQRDFNKLLSEVCDDVYSLAPVINNELINRHKLSGTISAARAKYLEALLEHNSEPEMGFPIDKFPPEKTIYYTLLADTGLHRDGALCDAPTNDKIKTLWDACESFMASSVGKPRRISELRNVLLTAPYKLKQGVLDFWIPTYLYIKRQDYSLYDVTTGRYIPNVNREFFDLLQKHPNDYAIKAFNVSGVDLQFYNQYRKFLNLHDDTTIKGDSFVETIKPFLTFYRRLNDYARHTQKFDHSSTISFRDVLANAKDPEKTFFEDLPKALGYSKTDLCNEEFVAQYCNLIQRAVRELRNCYNKLIDRIEEHLVEALSLESGEYEEYITEIRKRLQPVKVYLLTDRQREFYNHAMTEFDNRKDWYQSICYTALDQRLEELRDNQEEKLVDELIYLFRSCEKFANISVMTNNKQVDGEAFAFDLVGSDGTMVQNQTFLLPTREQNRSAQLETEIERLLTGNENVDVCTLLRILKKKASK